MAEPRRNAAPASRGWKESAPAGAPRVKGRRRRRLFGVLVAIGALLGALVALLLLLRGSRLPSALSVPVTAYDRQFPVNALARADSDALGDFFTDHRQAADRQEGRLLRKELDALRSRPADESVLLHLSALARTDANTVYLLPADADPDDPSTWLPLADVLQVLHDCHARHKVLILDAAHPCADPRLGILADDVAGRLPPLLEPAVAEDAALYVLLPCSPGQVALTSEELGQSVFGHYLVEGLRGRADGYNPDDRTDDTVTLDELAAFVTAHVDRWAQQNRGPRQTPMLLAKDRARARTIDLTQTRAAGRVPVREVADAPYPEALAAGWKHRDAWRDERVFEAAPSAFRELEVTLVRAEQHWRGRDVAADDLEKDLREQIARLDPQVAVARAGVPRPREPRSLALAEALGQRPPERKASDDLRTLARAAAEAAKAKDPAAAAEALRPKIEAAVKPVQDRPFALAWAVFEAAADDFEIDPDRLHFYSGKLLEADRPEPRFAETLLLHRLADLAPDRRTKNYPQEAVRLALQVARAGERAAVCQAERRRDKAVVTFVEPRALPWVRRVLQEAVKDRREGERRLLGGDAGAWDQARDSLRQAAQEYEKALDLIRAVAEAQQLQQDARVFLPQFAAYRLAAPRPELSDADWDATIRAARKLADLLARPAEQAPETLADLSATLDEVRQRTRDLRRPLDALRRRAQDAAEALRPERRGARPDPVLCSEADALLNSSLLAAPERVTLWKMGRELAQQLNKQTVEEEQGEGPAHRLAPPAPPDPAAQERDERRRAARRARVQIDLLKLAGLADADKLEQAAKALGPDAPPAAWQSVGDKLRAACTRGLATQVRECLAGVKGPDTTEQVPAGLVAADRLSRGIHPFDVAALQRAGLTDLTPAPRLRRDEARVLWRWLADLYQQEADRPEAPPVARDFYSRAADDYRSAAR
jgi:hypothetical protein